MYYDFSIAVPPNTPESDPVEQTLGLDAGIVQRLEIGFPAGCQGQVHCQLLYHEHQAWPTNPDGDFAADDYNIPIDEYYQLDTEPYELKARLWSTADTYTHTIAIRVGVLRIEDVESSSTIATGLKKLLALVGIKV